MITAIFDLDGTLADTLYDLADATNFALEKLGYPTHPYESYKKFVGNGVQKLCYRALPDNKKDDTENGVILAVATNKPQNFAREIVEKLLSEYSFIKVLGGCSERPKKPDISIINEILSETPKNNEVFMIGDSNVDIQTAKNANIHSIGCVWGFRGREELENAGADFIAETPEDIADFILK